MKKDFFKMKTVWVVMAEVNGVVREVEVCKGKPAAMRELYKLNDFYVKNGIPDFKVYKLRRELKK